jgi:hypothetical protein
LSDQELRLRHLRRLLMTALIAARDFVWVQAVQISETIARHPARAALAVTAADATLLKAGHGWAAAVTPLTRLPLPRP